jgi:hypothetical protein
MRAVQGGSWGVAAMPVGRLMPTGAAAPTSRLGFTEGGMADSYRRP